MPSDADRKWIGDGSRGGEGQWLCPRIKWDGEGDWQRLSCGVDGLDYVWGTTYTLSVLRSRKQIS